MLSRIFTRSAGRPNKRSKRWNLVPYFQSHFSFYCWHIPWSSIKYFLSFYAVFPAFWSFFNLDDWTHSSRTNEWKLRVDPLPPPQMLKRNLINLFKSSRTHLQEAIMKKMSSFKVDDDVTANDEGRKRPFFSIWKLSLYSKTFKNKQWEKSVKRTIN